MKYKVGDRVRILPRAVRTASVSESLVGFTGVITKMARVHYWVKLPVEQGGQELILDDTEIELVEKGKGD